MALFHYDVRRAVFPMIQHRIYEKASIGMTADMENLMLFLKRETHGTGHNQKYILNSAYFKMLNVTKLAV